MCSCLLYIAHINIFLHFVVGPRESHWIYEICLTLDCPLLIVATQKRKKEPKMFPYDIISNALELFTESLCFGCCWCCFLIVLFLYMYKCTALVDSSLNRTFKRVTQARITFNIVTISCKIDYIKNQLNHLRSNFHLEVLNRKTIAIIRSTKKRTEQKSK